MSHIWMGECHVAHMNKWVLLMSHNSCHTYEWASACFNLSHMSAWVLRFAVNESYHTCEWVNAMSHIWISGCFSCHSIHVTHMNERVLVLISHIWVRECFASRWMSHITHMGEWVPCRIYAWVVVSHVTQFMSHIWLSECLFWSHTYQCEGASFRWEWGMSHTWMRKHQRMCFSYALLIECRSRYEMTAMRTCVDTQCVAVCCSVL